MFRYRIAEPGSADLDSWLRLRTGLFLESGLITADDLERDSGFFVDQYDDHAVHVLATDDAGADVGCTRMIEPDEGRPLQVTTMFDIDPLPNSYESSGSAVVPELRKSWVSLGLYRATFAIAGDRGYEHTYAIVEPPYLASLRAIGFPFEVISDERHVFGHPNVAAVYERRDLLASMDAATSPLAPIVARYFHQPFEWTLTERDVEAPVS